MAKTKTRPTPKNKRKLTVSEAIQHAQRHARPARPTGKRLNIRIRKLSYDNLCTMALDDDLTVTAWLVRMIDREHERRDSLACAGEVRR